MPATTIDLHVSDADRILAHLLRLSAEDRSMRFSAGLVTDETIRQYTARIRFGHDLVIGQVSKLGQLIGLAHAAHFSRGWAGLAPRGRRHARPWLDASRKRRR